MNKMLAEINCHLTIAKIKEKFVKYHPRCPLGFVCVVAPVPCMHARVDKNVTYGRLTGAGLETFYFLRFSAISMV
jgi:hypothetical protein